MKVQTTIIALAITAATINAAPVELEERGKFGGISKMFGGSSSKPSGGADAPAPAYNKDSAGNLNAGMGLATQVGLLGVNGMTTQATENKNNDPSAQKRARPAAPGRSNSSPAAITNEKNPPGVSSGVGGSGKPADTPKKPESATSSDYMNTAAGTLGMANLGMGLYNADQGLQATQKRALPAAADIGLALMGGGPSIGVSKSNYQVAGNGNVKASGASSGRRSLMADELLGLDGFEKRALPAAASWGLALMGGGPSVGVTKSNSQSAGNGNVHMSGAKSRRQLQEESSELQRRLFSFSHSDSNQQSAGNGNVVASGASSGGVPSNADNLMASMNAGAAQKQKQQKREEDLARRLFSFSSQDYNTQSAGNGNVVASGASSGGVPSNADKLTATMQANAKGGGKRALMRRLINVSSSDQNQQVAGNGNVHMSGAKSGASPQFLASLNPGTAGAA